jgi:type II secretory pathway predicted ATPase ExeA
LETNPYNRFFSFFGLRENPFAASPDPRYLFMTPKLQEACDAIAYGIQSREGIVVLTGEAGTGKTTLINRLLEWLRERRMPTAFIFNSHLEPRHLFDFMLADFAVPPDPRWQGNSLLCLSQWLPERCREGRIPVLIVDEAQGLPLPVLEEIRLLMNLETSNQKQLQIVLAGQPELEEKLKRPEMRHFAQRIALRCKTAPLTLKETYEYIQVRLDVAGAFGKPIFSPEAVSTVHGCSRGIPRVMNLICEHSLINAYAANLRVVPARVVHEIAREFEFEEQICAPSFQSSTVRARVYEPMFPSEVTLPPAQEQPASSASAVPPTAVAQSVAAALNAIPQPAVLEQSTMATSIATPTSAPASTPTLAPTLASTSKPAPARTPAHAPAPASKNLRTLPPRPAVRAIRKAAQFQRAVLNAFAAVRDKSARALAAALLSVLSAIARTRLPEKGRDLRHALRRGFIHNFGPSVRRTLATTVKAGVGRGSNRVSIARATAAHSFQNLWKNAQPAWQEKKTIFLQWLQQPLAAPNPSHAPKPTSRPAPLWATFTHSLRLARLWQASQQPIRPALVPPTRPRRTAGVRRWLRQPFRGSDLVRLSSRASAQRNRMPSAL